MKNFRILILAIGIHSIHSWCSNTFAQINSGSNGSDGAFNPTKDVVIDMASHPNGIYQYTSINIPAGVSVSFVPNANNKPVLWLVQGDCVIAGTVSVAGQNGLGTQGGMGGPGGWAGGNGGALRTAGSGPGGASLIDNFSRGEDGTFEYGNSFLIPLLGGSGGCGTGVFTGGAGGGGGALLIAASGTITINGGVSAVGGDGQFYPQSSGGGSESSGGGSGGAIRLVASRLEGNGVINAGGGNKGWYAGGWGE
jgi:hypothetical protein